MIAVPFREGTTESGLTIKGLKNLRDKYFNKESSVP